MRRAEGNRRHIGRLIVTIGVIIGSWASAGAVAWSHWPQDQACMVDHAAIEREYKMLEVIDRLPPDPAWTERRDRVADCVMRGAFAKPSLRRAFPSLWHRAFFVWSNHIRAHGLPIVALVPGDPDDGDAYVVFAGQCESRLAIAEHLADIWVRGRAHYPAIRFAPVDSDFDPAVLQLEPNYAPLWVDGADAAR